MVTRLELDHPDSAPWDYAMRALLLEERSYNVVVGRPRQRSGHFLVVRHGMVCEKRLW